MTLIKTKNRHLFLKNVLNILKKGLNSVALLSRRYNQYFFDKINNEKLVQKKKKKKKKN